MRIRAAAVIVAVMASVLGPGAPPAEAASAGTMVFTGTLTVGAGIAYPCLDGPVFPAVDVAKCAGFLLPVNAAPAVFAATGVGAFANVAEAKCGIPACVEAGTFDIAAAGGVGGACGLGDGALAGAIAPGIAFGTKAKPRPFALTFVEIAGTVTMTGFTGKGEVITGVGFSVPNFAAGSTCTNKAAKAFILVGTLQFAMA